ncbi:hypothetical protein CLOSTHATH_03182 [Hungatella hathewayi DSM 13479]|uniref:Uncharacterized protein n=1 Tax=Hungatella hathewayi DSM 13479 TaxID=566550 RepID=D3AHU3_9FIRM|nr:hypothetical protein CLOSTHATH_03182 [Hungatella hathewayi DSM 13479]
MGKEKQKSTDMTKYSIKNHCFCCLPGVSTSEKQKFPDKNPKRTMGVRRQLW